MTETAEIIRASYEAFNERDPDRLREWLHPEFEVDLTNSMGFNRGTYRGMAGIRRFFGSYWDAFDPIAIDVEELIGSGDAIVAIIRARGRGAGSGAEVDARGPHLWRFRDGKAIGLALYGSTEAALEAAARAEPSAAQARRADPRDRADTQRR